MPSYLASIVDSDSLPILALDPLLSGHTTRPDLWHDSPFPTLRDAHDAWTVPRAATQRSHTAVLFMTREYS